jgi:hypothetical protein
MGELVTVLTFIQVSVLYLCWDTDYLLNPSMQIPEEYFKIKPRPLHCTHFQFMIHSHPTIRRSVVATDTDSIPK